MNTFKRFKVKVAKACPCNWFRKPSGGGGSDSGGNVMGDRALLVGINAYPNSPLSGCINDVTDVAQFLVSKCGFKEENIRLLTDGRATTSAIIERLNWLTQVSPGDRVYFHYSGHGAQMPTRNDASEIDNLSEVVCPVDFDWSAGHMVTDKQFVEIFKKIPAGVRFCWSSDSCHSGDLTKTMLAHNSPKILGYRKYPVPADISWRQRTARKNGLSRSMVGNVLDVGFISGCRSNQTSADAEFGGRPNGALTYFLLKSLDTMLDKPIVEVVAEVNKQLSSVGFEQSPQAEGARKDKAFLG